jgi:hypothetical protein
MKYIKTVQIDVDIPELIEGKSSDDLLDFITEIDEQHCNWDLTVKLYEHFSKQYDDFIAEGIDLKEN